MKNITIEIRQWKSKSAHEQTNNSSLTFGTGNQAVKVSREGVRKAINKLVDEALATYFVEDEVVTHFGSKKNK